MKNNFIQSGMLIEAYPRGDYAGYVVRCAMYIDYEIRSIPTHIQQSLAMILAVLKNFVILDIIELW